jgi:hypothetical protein
MIITAQLAVYNLPSYLVKLWSTNVFVPERNLFYNIKCFSASGTWGKRNKRETRYECVGNRLSGKDFRI